MEILEKYFNNEVTKEFPHFKGCSSCRDILDSYDFFKRYLILSNEIICDEIPDMTILLQYYFKELPEDQEIWVQNHISECEICKILYEDIKYPLDNKELLLKEIDNNPELQKYYPKKIPEAIQTKIKEFIASRQGQKAKLLKFQDIRPKYQESSNYALVAADSDIGRSIWPVQLECKQNDIRINIELNIIAIKTEYICAKLQKTEGCDKKLIILMCGDKEIILSDKYQEIIKKDDIDLMAENIDEIKRILIDKLKVKIL